MKVYAIGETVLDIIFKNGQPVSAKAGGSSLNASVSLGRLGINVSFISDYGNDNVGTLIDNFLRENHVATEHVVKFNGNKSALALAFLDHNNNASYSFYKDFPDKRLDGLSVSFAPDDYLLFGSLFAITRSVRENLLKVLKNAKAAGTTIIYDPNFRRPHLHELEMVKPWIIENIGFADVVKGSEEDFQLIFNAHSLNEAYKYVLEAGCDYLFYTRGADDVLLKTPTMERKIGVPEITTVSTIGAGDNFNAGLVYSLVSANIHSTDLANLSSAEWEKIAAKGVSFASNVCQSYDNYISLEFAKKLKSV